MTPTTLDCPRCQGSMEAGFVADRAQSTMLSTQNWVEGAPARSFWRGLDVRGHAVFAVRTLRCQSCGYLESYATDAVDLSCI